MMRVFYSEAVYGDEEVDAALHILKNQRHALMTGPKVAEFEAGISAAFGKKRGLMVNSGSSANLLALACLNLEKGAEVITPALTFSTTVAPIVQLGLTPVFVDSDLSTLQANAEQIEQAISPQTRAIMVPNLMGNLPDWRRIRDIANAHHLIVIEDSADTVGYRIDGQAGNPYSDVATTSFYASHVITGAGHGGMVCLNDDRHYERAMLLRGWGRRSSILGEVEDVDARFSCEVDGIPYDSKFVFDGLGYNFLPSEISAAFGLVQLRRLPQNSKRRNENFGRIKGHLARYADRIITFSSLQNVETNWLAFPLVFRTESKIKRRDFQIFLEKRNIQTRTVFTGNILRHPAMKGVAHRVVAESLPTADLVMRNGCLIGAHHGLSDAQVEYMLDVIDEFMKTH